MSNPSGEGISLFGNEPWKPEIVTLVWTGFSFGLFFFYFPLINNSLANLYDEDTSFLSFIC